MAIQSELIAWETLQPEEVETLLPRVRGQLGRASENDEEWIVLHAAGLPLASVIDRLNRLYRLSSGVVTRESRESHESQEQNLDRALTWLVAAGLGVEAELTVDNLELRARYMNETPMLTSAQIHQMSGLGSTNPSEPASRWKAEGKIFAVRVEARNRYPAFQFEDGAPRPVIKATLAALPATMTAWQTALWFASGNGWLDGAEPRNCLSDGDSVVEAARQLTESARG